MTKKVARTENPAADQETLKQKWVEVGLPEASFADWFAKHGAEAVQLLLSLMTELFGFKADPRFSHLDFETVKALGTVNRESEALGDCCDCFCCVVAVINDASKILAECCCKCCSEDGCTVEERRTACDTAGKLLIQGRILLLQCCP